MEVHVNRSSSWRILAVGLMAAMGFVLQPATAQDKKLVFRVADQFPTGNFFPRYGIKPWMDQVAKATNGEVQFQYYPAEQLGKAKDLLALVQSGVTDAAMFIPGYASDKMPLTAVMELPGLFESSCHGNASYWKLARDGGTLAQLEYAPNGVRVLFSGVYPPSQLISAKRKIDSPADLEGFKVRVPGGIVDMTMRKLKAIGVKMSGPEIHEAMARATVDGAIVPYGPMLGYGIQAKYVTAGEAFGSVPAIFIVAESRWKQLPDHVKKAMTEAGEAANQSLCAGVDAEEIANLETLKQKGVTVVRWSAADKSAANTASASVANEWAAEMDKRGKPGSKVLKAALETRDAGR